jgi:hypothetical protein
LACGDPREIELASGRGTFEDTGVAAPGAREVQAFSLPTRSALSSQSFVATDPFERLRFDDAVALAEAGGHLYVAQRTGRSTSASATKAATTARARPASTTISSSAPCCASTSTCAAAE